MDLGPVASERARQIAYSMRRPDFFEVFLATWCRRMCISPHKSQGSAPQPQNLAKSKLAGDGTLETHRSTHRLARDMGLAANERARQTAYIVKRLIFFNVILATWCRGEWGNRPKLKVFQPQKQLQASYGHGSGGK
jgi:hypothetical protein